jgi:hypothetical protein
VDTESLRFDHALGRFICLLSLLLFVCPAEAFGQSTMARRTARPRERALALSHGEAGAIVAIVRAGETKCTGLLVGASKVLTAAHCLTSAPDLSVRFSAGNGRAFETRQVVAVVKHRWLDAGLLDLDAPLPRWIVPFRLPSVAASAPEVGRTVSVAGRGQSSAGFNLDVVRATVVGAGTELVVAYAEKAGLCRGDSGGPLVERDVDGRLVVWGILRGGAMDCRGPDRFTRTTGLREWVDVAAREVSSGRIE